jgi:hypothetical protein
MKMKTAYHTYLKAFLAFFITIMMIVPGVAQISLDVDDLPKPGNVQISIKVDSTQGVNLLPGPSGANIIWDFSMLNPCCGNLQSSQDTVAWINHYNTANAGYFPLSNIARKERCYTYHSHITHTDITECLYDHYIADNTGLYKYGLEDPVKVVLNADWNVFPILAYGDSTENVAKIHIPVSSDTLRVYHIISKSVADGWGTITIPDTTAQVIRIKTTEIVYDTLYINNVVADVQIYPENYYYRWYAKSTGFPIVQINKGFQNQEPPYFQQVQYYAKSISAMGITENNPAKGFHVYPNPFTSIVTLQLDAGRTLVSVSLYNSIGKRVQVNENITDNKVIINGEKLRSGIYFYTIVLNNNDSFGGTLVKY